MYNSLYPVKDKLVIGPGALGENNLWHLAVGVEEKPSILHDYNQIPLQPTTHF